MHFGKALKKIRKQLDISEEEFSRDLDINLATLEEWEHNADSPSEFIKNRIIEYYLHRGILVELPSKAGEKRNFRYYTEINAGLAGAQTEVVKRYGSAAKEHFVAYVGADNETGEKLAKGLKKIASSKVNHDYHNVNIKQQAGFSAEVKTVARENAGKIIAGDKKTKKTRTDDMEKQSDGKGNNVGGKNEQLYDVAEVDKNGIYVEGTARQLKFVGGTPEECTKKLLGAKYDKYRDADVAIEVPSDFYDSVKGGLDEKAEKIKRQIKTAEKKGNSVLAGRKKTELEKIEKTSGKLEKGKVSNKEAIEARLHPKLSTAKDVLKISRQAGVEAAKSGALIGGGLSFIRNSVSVIKGDKKASEAALEVVGDTTKAATLSYTTAFVGSALKGSMQNASIQYIRCLSKTNVPAIIVTSVLEAGKSLSRYARGEIDGTECLNELGEKGTGMLASAFGATIGQVLIPIPVVGGLIGGMVGYAMASAYYNSLVNALNEAKVAHEERMYIEAECREAIIEIRNYQLEIELVINNYLREYSLAFDEALRSMSQAYNVKDVDGFIEGANKVIIKLSGKLLFKNKTQFDELMASTSAVEI